MTSMLIKPFASLDPDVAGTKWFHVIHRGIGRRPVFSTSSEIRSLLNLIDRESERDGLELHAYSILTNHCHLLVRARLGGLSSALQRVFAVYSRRQNRRLRRDGPLFGSRARVRRIRSSGHWRATVAYIDRNPVDAGLTNSPARYPFGSAWHYSRPAGPPWLRREVIEDFVRCESGTSAYRPADYARVFGHASAPAGAREVVARRLERPEQDEDPLDDLLAAAPVEVRGWLERMARRADGASAGPALVDPRTLKSVLDKARRGRGAWLLEPVRSTDLGIKATRAQRGGVRRDGWSVLACGLLRSACGLTLEEIGGLVGLSVGGVHFQIRCHRRLVVLEGAYKARAEQLLTAALKIDFPGGAPSGLPGALWSE